MCLVEFESTVDHRGVERTFHTECAFCRAAHGKSGFFQEGIGDIKGERTDIERTVEIAFPLRIVRSADFRHLLAVEGEIAVGNVLTVLAGLVHQLGAECTDLCSFVREVFGGRGTHSRKIVLVFNDMEITVQRSTHLGKVRQHIGQFAQIEAIDGEGNVVFQTITSLTVDLQPRSVIGQQLDVGAHAAVVAHKEIIVGIDGEIAISHHRRVGVQVQTRTAVLHFHLRAETQTQSAVSVLESNVCCCAGTQQVPVQGGEERIRVLRFAVFDGCREFQPLFAVRNSGLYRVDYQAFSL